MDDLVRFQFLGDLDTQLQTGNLKLNEYQPDNDSGYGSNGTERTAIVSHADTETAETSLDEAPDIHTRRDPTPFPLADQDGVFQYDVSISAGVRERWKDVCFSLSSGLAGYLQEPGRSDNRASIRLVVLGRNAADAKPSIVVFCPKTQHKRVKKFFDQDMIKELCQPGCPELPSFQFYLGSPLKLRGGEDFDIFKSSATNYCKPQGTLCGTSILLSHRELGSASIATLGGIVKVTYRNGNFACFGMTSGHVIPSAASLNSGIGKYQMAGQLHPVVCESRGQVNLSPEIELEHRRTLLDELDATRPLGYLGCILDECLKQSSPDDEYYDWALCRLDGNIQPNYMCFWGSKIRDGPYPELQSSDLDIFNFTDDILVAVLTGSGPKNGWLSTMASPIMVGPGNAFVTAFTVSFSCPGKPYKDHVFPGLRVPRRRANIGPRRSYM